MIVSFTGHRPTKLGGYNTPNRTYSYIMQELRRTLQELKPDKAISGMALGWDQWAAQTCIDLHIPFVAAIPFAGQDKVWPQSSKDIYKRLLQEAAEVVVVCEGSYTAQKMQIRNEWMCDKSDILIACFIKNEKNGGTFNCMQYAKKQNKDILVIDPTTIEDIDPNKA